MAFGAGWSKGRRDANNEGFAAACFDLGADIDFVGGGAFGDLDVGEWVAYGDGAGTGFTVGGLRDGGTGGGDGVGGGGGGGRVDWVGGGGVGAGEDSGEGGGGGEGGAEGPWDKEGGGGALAEEGGHGDEGGTWGRGRAVG